MTERPRETSLSAQLADSAGPANEAGSLVVSRATRADRRLFSVLVLLLTSWLAVSCLSPTLPLPPPSDPFITAPDSDGLIQIKGRVTSGAEVTVLNTRTSIIAGFITGEDGAYSIQMEAEIGDLLLVRQQSGTQESAPNEVYVPSIDQGGAIPPPAIGSGGAGNE